LVAVSQNGNKILSYSPGKESWDILTEEVRRKDEDSTNVLLPTNAPPFKTHLSRFASLVAPQHEFMKAPRSIVWISATNFLVSSFFIDQVHEYRMDGTYVGLFCEVFEPEGIVLLPPPFNLVVVTSMDNGQLLFFNLDDGINDGSLGSSDAAATLYLTSGDTPHNLAYDPTTHELYVTTWSNYIERVCLPSSILSPHGLSCDSNRDGEIAYELGYSTPYSIVLVPEEEKYIVPCEIPHTGEIGQRSYPIVQFEERRWR
jgi:hypothetical protein